MERPKTWPKPELHHVWDTSRADFAREIASAHDGRVVLDWGFPPGYRSLVEELQAAGVVLCWLHEDEALARESFLRRSAGNIADFELQIRLIREAGYPKSLGAIEIETLSAKGFRDWSETWEIIQAGARAMRSTI
jgi:hypothetical protein